MWIVGLNSALATEAVLPGQTELSTGFELAKILFGLMVVLGLFFAIVWFIKKIGNIHPQQDKLIKIIGGTAIGTKERLILVEVGKEQFVVGVSAQGMQTLHTLSEPLDVSAEQAPSPTFLQHLKAAKNQKAES